MMDARARRTSSHRHLRRLGIGFDPPIYLKQGDVVAITIEPIGTLENPVG